MPTLGRITHNMRRSDCVQVLLESGQDKVVPTGRDSVLTFLLRCRTAHVCSVLAKVSELLFSYVSRHTDFDLFGRSCFRVVGVKFGGLGCRF